jgi:Mor family transcriptional regulator
MNRPKTKAERLLGPALLRQVQRRAEGTTIVIPKRNPSPGGRPAKVQRNNAICAAVANGISQRELARKFELTEGRISAIIKAGRGQP